MPFLPSLLEYSIYDLQTKLQLIKNYPVEFQAIQRSPDGKIYLHLDFVLPEFAASRSVQSGNRPKIVFDLIHKYFQDQKVVCNSHFMGFEGDIAVVLGFFKTYTWNPNWEYILYVGPEFLKEFEQLKESTKKTSIPIEIKIGTWLDLDQYNSETKFELQDYLLMTVFAGKSGQKLMEDTRLKTLGIIKQNSNINFTVDGGWVVKDELKELTLKQKENLSIVSYSSFWKEFEKLINQSY